MTQPTCVTDRKQKGKVRSGRGEEATELLIKGMVFMIKINEINKRIKRTERLRMREFLTANHETRTGRESST